MDAVIGFDTSCYTTSVAAVSMDGTVLCNARKILPVPVGQRGLRQNDALYNHVNQLPELVKEVSTSIRGYTIRAVCASTRPRDEEKSYMPVFKAGTTMGRSLASVLGVPFFETDHQHGHVAAAAYGTGLNTDTFLAVHLSGGTSELLRVAGDGIHRLGGTLDLNAGQLVDRIGVALGLQFPAGPYLEQYALQGKAEALLTASPEKGGLYFHLSGNETQCLKWISEKKYTPEKIAAEVFDLIARCVTKMIVAGEKSTGLHDVLIAGGVSSSTLLRDIIVRRTKKLSGTLNIYFGEKQFSGDNAVGVAIIGAKSLIKQGEK